MNRFLAVILLTFFVCSAHAKFRVLHYNIKEVSTEKILSMDLQFTHVKSVVSRFPFDVISINEVQYDRPGVPLKRYYLEGQNLLQLAPMIGVSSRWNYSFNPANTGNNAKKLKNGDYVKDFSVKNSRRYADPLNFGIYPHQYSTGALFKYKKIGEEVFSKITWKEFNPKIDLTKFTGPAGEKVPDSVELFDKNFSDISLKIEGKIVHLILLHTVPAFHFGNKKSMNYLRNRDQLRFLEWYLTGKTDIPVPPNFKIKPLKKDAYFIAVGDFNSDIRNEKNPGSLVLKRLMKSTNPWTENISFTNESSNFAPNPLQLALDYLFVSKNIKPLSGEIYRPLAQRKELGCKKKKWKQSKGRVVVDYFHKKKKRKCYVEINKDYYTAKMASDHFPIWGEFQFIK